MKESDGYDAKELMKECKTECNVEYENRQNSRAYGVHPTGHKLPTGEQEAKAKRMADVAEIEKFGIDVVNKYEMEAYIEALKILKEGTFMEYCAEVVNTYHAGDHKLTRLLLRGALRPSFSSRSALLHFATTGRSGGGKNDIINNITALIPSDNLVMFASITSQVLYYSMRVPTGNKNETVMDPYHYKNKIIVVSEIADSSGFSALKAFAELDEQSAFTHSTTSGSKQLDLTVHGPRALWITSVIKVGDEQVDRRFIHSSIEPENDAIKREKTHAITNSLINQCTIFTDARVQICKAGFAILYNSHPVFEPPTQDVSVMIDDLNMMLADEGCSPSKIKQTYALMECAAVERQFKRGYVRIEAEDVLEGWYLSGFCSDKEVLLGGDWCKPTKVE